MNCSFIEHFSSLKDRRIERKKLHMLIDILVLTVCATLSGTEGWEEIEEFGHSKLNWLRRFVPLKNGLPSHDCIAYVISRLSPEGFRRCFMSWVEAMREEMPGEVIAIDGKTARGSRDRKRNKNPLHMVSAWACASRLVLGQEVTEEKSSEILSSRLLIRAVITYWDSKATKVRFMKQRKIFFKVASDTNFKRNDRRWSALYRFSLCWFNDSCRWFN